LPAAPERAGGVGGRRFILPLVAMLAVGVILRLPTFTRPLLSDDEAIYAATADAMRTGALLYRDAVDHKPPLIYFLYQLGFRLFGPFEMFGPHLFVVLAVLATALALFALGRKGRGGDRAGLVAAGLFLVSSTSWHDYDALAANCELFLLAPQSWAAVLLFQSLSKSTKRDRFALHLGVGALVGLSVLCKYQGMTFFGVTAAVLTVAALDRRLHVREAVALFLVGLVGAAIPILAYGAWAAAVGSLAASIDWFRFNFLYVGAGLTGREALVRGLTRLGMIGAMALPAYLFGGAGAVNGVWGFVAGLVARVRGSRVDSEATCHVELIGLFWLLTSLVALAAGGRFFGHYFHLILAPLCLLAGPLIVRFVAGSRVRAAAVALAALLPAGFFFFLATAGRPLAEKWDEAEPPYAPVAAGIAAASAPSEKLFVWGNSPQLYVLARRSMGTRFSFCNYMTGESPGTPTETGGRDADANSFAASWTMLFDDLDRHRPALFVDAAAAGWDGYDKFPVTRYPRLTAYLAAHYRKVAEVERVVIYRRFP
jgi:Dolichyl-phosphate-mannose-protein mannosyltransferase